MGEKSKTTGELGEKTYSEMIQLFGWAEATNISIKCNERKKHSTSTHGIDSLVVQDNPLIADETELGIVSVKNYKAGSSPSNFKKFADDIIETSACFMRSSKSQEYYDTSTSKTITSKQILFWFTNDKDSNYSVINQLLGNSYPTTQEKFNQLIVVDNRVVSFHYDLRQFVDSQFKESISVEYFYPHMGLNEKLTSLRILQGKKLPVDWITSPVIPYKIRMANDKYVLVLGLNESFDEDSFRRLSGLSQNLTGGWCNKIVLCFPDYRYKEHKEIKEKVLLQIADKEFSKMIEVYSFKQSFQSLEEATQNYFLNSDNKDSQDFNIERMLPFGDTLRQLLSQPYITKSDIIKILNRRGVFVNKYAAKSDLIPILSVSFISPSELESEVTHENSIFIKI